MTQVFISYSRNDMLFVEKFAADLTNAGVDVWWDINSIQGSDIWEKKIEEGLRTSQFFIVVMSPDAMNSRWVQREYISADWMGIPIVPIKYKECLTPLTLRDAQAVDYVEKKYDKFLDEVLAILGAKNTVKPKSFVGENNITIGGIEFLRIPAGEFVMGCGDLQTGKKLRNVPIEYDQQPEHRVDINYDYWMGKYPITNSQYSKYAEEKHFQIYPMSGWQSKMSHPVVNVSWSDARSYAKWFNEKYQKELKMAGDLMLRLPTEAEWEKAARGSSGNQFPWGNTFEEKKCNLGIGTTTPVGSYSAAGGNAPYGCADMLGNVWEWCQDLYKISVYQDRMGKIAVNPLPQQFTYFERVVRGGSFNNLKNKWLVHCATRYYQQSGNHYEDTGFRMCLAPKDLGYVFR